ncbi:MAG: hypothetical protein OXB95_02740 [Rhodobacteraceae bacterium]|nr:hypothetical protein [Paracoccaceae bacterium]
MMVKQITKTFKATFSPSPVCFFGSSTRSFGAVPPSHGGDFSTIETGGRDCLIEAGRKMPGLSRWLHNECGG